MSRKEYNRMYYLKHRDKIIKRSSEWNKNNYERYKEYNIQRYKKLYIYNSVKKRTSDTRVDLRINLICPIYDSLTEQQTTHNGIQATHRYALLHQKSSHGDEEG